MIVSPDTTTIISSLGWVDGGGLWILDTGSQRTRHHRLSDARYLSLFAGREGHFSVLHHFPDGHIEISAHRFDDPPRVVARMVASEGQSYSEGATSAWRHVPYAYVAHYLAAGASGFRLFYLNILDGTVEIQRLEWFDNGPYDHTYQGIISVTPIPNDFQLLFSIQRSSQLVIYDPEAQKLTREIELAGRGGNPELYFRRSGEELWATDYDTLLRLDTRDWQVKDSALLQSAEQGSRQFIGSFCFDRDETLCAVARPFSADVVLLDADSFELQTTINLGQQPLQLGLLSDGRIYARDWRSGNLLKGVVTG